MTVIKAVRFGKADSMLVGVPRPFGSNGGTLLQSSGKAFNHGPSF